MGTAKRPDPRSRLCRGGVVASGSPFTSEAGAEALRAGGNAVDAAVAAVFASCISEPALTSAAGAGQMLLHLSGAQPSTRVFDFFADAPGRDLPAGCGPPLDFRSLHLDFGSTTQEFHIGRGSAAVPGCLVGLCHVHALHGALPIAEVLGPAIALAREGIEVSAACAWTIRLLSPILCLTGEGREMFTRNGELLGPGSRCDNRLMAGFLAQVASEGEHLFHHGPLARLIVSEFGPPRGCITAADLEGYQVHEREPLVVEYRGHRIHLPPPPSAGGSYVAFGLELMRGFPVPEWAPFGHERLGLVCGALELAGDAVPPGWLHPRGPADGDWTALRKRLVERMDARRRDSIGAPRDRGPGNTTHVSVLDGQGNAVAVTSTCGESCGAFVPGTGVLMNNFMGEAGINPGGFFSTPAGARMWTMVAPALIESPGGTWTALGTGGSDRIRSSMLHVLTALADCGLALHDAVEGPRTHLDSSGVYVEAEGPGRAAAEALQFLYPGLTVFPERNFFFGGVHVARRHGATGELEGAGDPRRGGAVVVVPGAE